MVFIASCKFRYAGHFLHQSQIDSLSLFRLRQSRRCVLANSLFHSVWRRSGNLMSSSAHMADVSDLLLFGPVDTIQNSSPFQGEIAIAPYSSDSTKCYGHTDDDGQTTQKRPSNISARIMDCPDRHVSVC